MTSLPLIILDFLLLLGGSTATQREYYTYGRVGLNGFKFAGNVIFESQAFSVLHCALMCSRYQFCLTFTFDSERSCRGHSSFVMSDTPTTFSPGARTFVRSGAAPPKNCQEVQVGQSSVVTIYNHDGTTLRVFCDQDTEGGGWMVFQRRRDGSENFYRNWTDYQTGFGDHNGEFWLVSSTRHLEFTSFPLTFIGLPDNV